MKTALLLLLIGCFTACAHDAVTGSNEIDSFATRDFPGGYGNVFAAVKHALKSDGYDIIESRVERGILLTNRRSMGAAYRRQYDVSVTRAGANTRVRLTPRIFADNKKLGSDSWVLEGPEGERALWDRLFAAVQQTLQEMQQGSL
jgi:hypothetical protein